MDSKGSGRRGPGDASPAADAGTVESYCPTCEASFTPTTQLSACPHDGTRLVQFRSDEDGFIGTIIDGRFEIREKLGAGGMGSVYRALQTSVGREVAIKVIDRDRSKHRAAAKRFLREAKLTSRLSHPNIVVVHDFGHSSDGILYIVMEMVAGHTLRQLLRQGGAMPPERILDIATQLCDALETAHGMEIVHRDLKPANIMILDQPPGRDRVKVLDFGLAKSFTGDSSSTTITNTGAVMGTPRYISPEMIRHDEVDERCDLYSLGCILYEMATGKPPFGGSSVQQIFASHLFTEAQPLAHDGLGHLAAVIEALMAKNPAERPASATETREMLHGQRPVPARPDARSDSRADARSDSRASPVASLADPAGSPGLATGLALETPPETLAPGSGVAATPVDRAGQSGGQESGRRPGRLVWWLAAGAVVALLVAIVGLSGIAMQSVPPWQADRQESPEGAVAGTGEPRAEPSQGSDLEAGEPAAVGEAADAGATLVATMLRATPAADVTIDGRELGRTPLRYEAAAGSGPVVAIFTRSGYRSERRTITPGEQEEVAVELQRRRKKDRARGQDDARSKDGGKKSDDPPDVDFILND